jgi:hypothetical protein
MVLDYSDVPVDKKNASSNISLPFQSRNTTLFVGIFLGSLPALLLIFFFRRHILILIGKAFCCGRRDHSSSIVIDYSKL